MSQNRSTNPRLVAIALLAGLILLALVVATGGGFPGQGTSGPPPPPVAQEPPTVPAGGQMHGAVTISLHHLGGHTWRFLYVVRNTGSVPIAGFQINAPRSNLFHITGMSGWSYYGSGVCGGNYQGVLIYWSTGPVGPTPIAPKGNAHFGFDVNTTGNVSAEYSLSWTNFATFGTTRAPAASSLPPSGSCK